MTIPAAHDVAGVVSALEADGALLFVRDGNDLRVADLWPDHPARSTLSLPIGFGVTGVVARNGEPVLLGCDSPRHPLHRQLLGLKPQQTIARMCVPLPGLQGQVVGVLAVHRDPGSPFGSTDLDLAQRVARAWGMQVHAEQLWRSVNEHRSERDLLIRQAISAQEAERRRIAFDLHDGVTTALASMSFHLSAVDLTVAEITGAAPQAGVEVARARAELASARELADLAYHQTRAAISGLHSLVLDDLGLVAALESLVQSAGADDGPRLDLMVDPSAGLDDLPDHAAAALYRIAQEAVSNAVRHAGAERIVLSLRRVGESIVLACTDDGDGFDQHEARTARAKDAAGAQHFGLSSIAERCALMEASLRIESLPGRGTTVLVDLPLS